MLKIKPRDNIKYYKNKEEFNRIKSLQEEIYQVCKSHRFTQLDAFFVRWKKFFHSEKYCKKSDNILDFGCASGFSIFTAKKHGFNNIYGLDIKNAQYDSIVKPVIEIIDVKDNIIFYKGYGQLPFADNYFDVIVGWSAITKDTPLPDREERFNTRIKELVRISKESATWYIRPTKHLSYIKNKYNELKLSKNIKIKVLEATT